MPSLDEVTVLLADDHAAARVGVRMALDGTGFRVCAEAATADEAIAAARAERPAVALLDVRMPGGGISAARVIADELPETAIVMLTASRSDDDLLAALRAGAVGYLLKDTSLVRLPLALRGVLDGEAALPRTLVTTLIAELRGRERRRRRIDGHELTEREWEILDLLHDGHSTRRVADELGISAVTVRRHVSSVMRKLDVSSREDALRLIE